MATFTERVADDMIHQKLRAIGENSAAEGQVLPKYLDISKDPPPPSAEEFTQASPEERAERHERFESRRSGHVQQESPAQPHDPDSEPPSDGTLPNAEGSEMEKSETTRRRIAGKRAVEDDVSVSSKKERLECADLSLVSPPPETSSVETYSELRLRLRSKRPAVDSQVEQSKRSCADELSIVPWPAPSGGKRNLEVDEEMQSKKQCISERVPSVGRTMTRSCGEKCWTGKKNSMMRTK